MEYFRFFLTHPRVLSFGVLLTLFSSFGQTFLISIFVPRLLDAFAMSTSGFGALYAAATLTSAASLPFFGRLIDRMCLRRFCFTVGLGLAAACLAMALAPNVAVLFLAILGLRLTGQGLLSLTASTTMARVFERGRGKALSVSGLGYPLGEGMLPLLVILLIHAVGWRLSWAILGGVIALVLLPAIHPLLRGSESRPGDLEASPARPKDRAGLLRDWRFYALLPGILFLPFVLTALFLYQVPLAEDRGWSAQTMATAFVGFACARMFASLIAGPLIDRCGAVRLFSWVLVPICAGLFALGIGSSPWVAFAYLALAGVSQGLAGPMMTALWVEVYGIQSLGTTKGTVATIGIFATALGPMVLGWLLEIGVSFSWIVPGCASFGIVAIGLGLVVRRRILKSGARGSVLARDDDGSRDGADSLARGPKVAHDCGMVRDPKSTVELQVLTAPTLPKGSAAVLLACMAAILCGSWSCRAAEVDAGSRGGQKRPNILFLFADDWGRHASAYAQIDGPGTVNDAIRTPHFDRVAREGVLFRHAFVSAPSCTPCRSAILSGQHFWRTGRGSILRGAVWDGSNPSYMLLLRDAGYHIGKTYKVWAPGIAEVSPHGGPGHTYEKAGGRYNQFSQNVTKMVEEGKSIEAAKRVLYDQVMSNFEAYLADRKPGQPFCYWFGPTQTHRKWIKGSGKLLWGIDPDSLKGKMPPYLPDVHEVREDLADYFGEAQSFDAAIGLLVDKLASLGELENTLVAISGDHGAPGFPHGKCNLYDFGASVPLAVRWGGARGGRVVDDLVSLPDLAPTFLEVAGVPVPGVMTARSLVGLLVSEKSGRVDPARDAAFIGRERHVENAREGFLPYPQRAIRTPGHLYIINFKPDRWPLGEPYRLDGDNPPGIEELTEETRATLPDEDAGPAKAWLVSQRDNPQWRAAFELAYGKRPREELYDLKSDPNQVRNVAADPAQAEVRAKLERRLMDELARTGDPRLAEDGKFFETPPMAGPTKDVERQGGGKTPEELRLGPQSPKRPD